MPSQRLLVFVMATVLIAWCIQKYLPTSVSKLELKHEGGLPVLQWHELEKLLAASSNDVGPCIVQGSPQQKWLENEGKRMWSVENFIRSTSSPNAFAGTTRVSLHSKMETDAEFTHHYEKIRLSSLNDDISTTRPAHRTHHITLAEALSLIWPNQTYSNQNLLNKTQAYSELSKLSPLDSSSFYLSIDVMNLPPELLPYDSETLLSWIPEGCLTDDTRFHKGFRMDKSSKSSSAQQRCRGLASNLWIGSKGVSATTHYDLQHNFVLQTSGSKRWLLLEPKSHFSLQLYPQWHGSARQCQDRLGDILKVPHLTVTLEEGMGLYVPPLWLHYVESTSPSISANFWTDSLYSDIWSLLFNLTADSDYLPYNERHVGLFTGSNGNRYSMFRILVQSILGLLPDKNMIDMRNSEMSPVQALALQVLTSRYSFPINGDASTWSPKKWDSSIISLRSQDQIALERRQVVDKCRSARHENSLNLPKLNRDQMQILRQYANALGSISSGSRSLIIQGWIEELAVWVLASEDNFGTTHAGAFLFECLYRS